LVGFFLIAHNFTYSISLCPEWPLGPLVNQTRVQCGVELADEEWVMSRLQLEPMGFVFIVFFLVILLIQVGGLTISQLFNAIFPSPQPLFLQFLAMLFHRFGTMAHIIASTELCCSRRPVDKLTEEELMAQNAVEIARQISVECSEEIKVNFAGNCRPLGGWRRWPMQSSSKRRQWLANTSHSPRLEPLLGLWQWHPPHWPTQFARGRRPKCVALPTANSS
jgi:hypothetical protein